MMGEWVWEERQGGEVVRGLRVMKVWGMKTNRQRHCPFIL